MSTEKENTLADRYNEGKRQWSLIDFESIEGLARALEYGADKYARDNWKKGLPVNQVLDSLFRHIVAFKSGEDKDAESGLLHTDHMFANVMFLAYVMKNKPELDDR